jgi:hypothetical protein
MCILIHYHYQVPVTRLSATVAGIPDPGEGPLSPIVVQPPAGSMVLCKHKGKSLHQTTLCTSHKELLDNMKEDLERMQDTLVTTLEDVMRVRAKVEWMYAVLKDEEKEEKEEK